MAVITISLPKELKKELDSHPEVNWTEVIRGIFIRKIRDFNKFEEHERKRGVKYA